VCETSQKIHLHKLTSTSVAQANGGDSVLPSIEKEVTGEAPMSQIKDIDQSETPHGDVEDGTQLVFTANSPRQRSQKSSEGTPVQPKAISHGRQKKKHNHSGSTPRTTDIQGARQSAAIQSSAAKAGHVASHSTSSTQTRVDQHEVHDINMLDGDNHINDEQNPAVQSRPSAAALPQPTAPSDIMLALANTTEPKQQLPADLAPGHTPTRTAPPMAVGHATDMSNHADVKRHNEPNPIAGNADHNKPNKSKAKTKPSKVPMAPTSFKSDQLYGLYQHTLFAEQAQEVEALKKTITAHNSTIGELREHNEALGTTLLEQEQRNLELENHYAEKEQSLKDAQAKVIKFANYMKRLDKDFPMLGNSHNVLKQETQMLLDARHEEVEERQAEIEDRCAENERARAKYQGVVVALQSEIGTALKEIDDLRAQHNKSELLLSEERFRSLGFEKQLQLAATAKNDMLGKLGELQAQFGSIESLLQKKSDSSAMASAIDSILVGISASTTSEDMKSGLKHLEDTVRHLHERWAYIIPLTSAILIFPVMHNTGRSFPTRTPRHSRLLVRWQSAWMTRLLRYCTKSARSKLSRPETMLSMLKTHASPSRLLTRMRN
jgi:hypothetical protein